MVKVVLQAHNTMLFIWVALKKKREQLIKNLLLEFYHFYNENFTCCLKRISCSSRALDSIIDCW